MPVAEGRGTTRRRGRYLSAPLPLHRKRWALLPWPFPPPPHLPPPSGRGRILEALRLPPLPRLQSDRDAGRRAAHHPRSPTAAFARIKAGARAEPSLFRAVRHRRLDALFALVVSPPRGIRQRHHARLRRSTGPGNPSPGVFPTRKSAAPCPPPCRPLDEAAAAPRLPPFLPGSAETRPQPLGCIGVVAPWNHPLYLTAAPLASILAAGNRALLKFSEYSPATAAACPPASPLLRVRRTRRRGRRT